MTITWAMNEEFGALAWRISIIEFQRYKMTDADMVEFDKSIHLSFDILDGWGVPMLMQNCIMKYARRMDIRGHYLRQIIAAAVAEYNDIMDGRGHPEHHFIPGQGVNL